MKWKIKLSKYEWDAVGSRVFVGWFSCVTKAAPVPRPAGGLLISARSRHCVAAPRQIVHQTKGSCTQRGAPQHRPRPLSQSTCTQTYTQTWKLKLLNLIVYRDIIMGSFVECYVVILMTERNLNINNFVRVPNMSPITVMNCTLKIS